MAAGPAACATRPKPPWLDALNMKPYLSPTWAALRLTVAKTTPLSLYCPCLLRSLTIHACLRSLRSPAASYVCSAYPAQRSHGPGGAGSVAWRALALLSSTLRTLASQPSLCGLPQTERPWA